MVALYCVKVKKKPSHTSSEKKNSHTEGYSNHQFIIAIHYSWKQETDTGPAMKLSKCHNRYLKPICDILSLFLQQEHNLKTNKTFINFKTFLTLQNHWRITVYKYIKIQQSIRRKYKHNTTTSFKCRIIFFYLWYQNDTLFGTK